MWELKPLEVKLMKMEVQRMTLLKLINPPNKTKMSQEVMRKWKEVFRWMAEMRFKNLQEKAKMLMDKNMMKRKTMQKWELRLLQKKEFSSMKNVVTMIARQK